MTNDGLIFQSVKKLKCWNYKSLAHLFSGSSSLVHLYVPYLKRKEKRVLIYLFF
jgi:hypothetical protein